ncbi:uncharacterized protein LOC135952334 [Calliphora vicina]|uniref:uncharacterized protein LOC135952334 n=1 Tax=Calliphora vicina TaxID=7373 RepID=UPI00325B7967
MVGHETTIEVNSDDDNNAETTLTQNPSNQSFVEPAPRSWKNIRGFKEPGLQTDIDDFNQGSKKKKGTALPDDPLDENTSSSKNDSFEQWVNKKKQFLELEVLEMRNYKMKLELWEKEQQLNVKCSKFTRGIEKTHQ